MTPNKNEGSFNIPTIADLPDGASETQYDEQGRPFVVVDGRRYILASDEAPLDLAHLPENPKLAQIPAPPRDVSTVAKLVLFFASSPMATFGWIWLCLTMIFAAAFCGILGLGTAFYEKIGSWEPFATARLVSCDEAKFSVNGQSAQIWRFEGTAPDGSTFQGHSYSFLHREPGGKVKIERRKGTTDVLRVRGTSIAKASSSMVFWFVPFAVIALFLSLGVYLAVIGPIRRGFKTLPILRHGVATQGVPIDVKETGLRMNQTPEMRVTYRFQAADGNEHEAFVKSFHVEKLTDEPTKVLLYDPGNPDHLFVFDALPKGIKLLPGGYFDANPARLILPIFFVAILITEIVVAGAFMFRFDRATFSPANSAPVQASANAEPSNAD